MERLRVELNQPVHRRIRPFRSHTLPFLQSPVVALRRVHRVDVENSSIFVVHVDMGEIEHQHCANVVPAVMGATAQGESKVDCCSTDDFLREEFFCTVSELNVDDTDGQP